MVSVLVGLEAVFGPCWSDRIKAKRHVSIESDLLCTLFKANLVTKKLTEPGLYRLKGEQPQHASGVPMLVVYLYLEAAC